MWGPALPAMGHHKQHADNASQLLFAKQLCGRRPPHAALVPSRLRRSRALRVLSRQSGRLMKQTSPVIQSVGACEQYPIRKPISEFSAKNLRMRPIVKLASPVSICKGTLAARNYFSFAYSAWACFRMGMSGSASFQRERKSL
jgi:hypothetical protein